MAYDQARAVLSIQSEVAYGHVGNSAAVLPLQRLGFDVWPVNTVQLGHHPGYGRFSGYHVEAERLAAVLDGVLTQASLGCCSGMLVGYLGDAVNADPVLRALETVRRRNEDLVFLLDPVIGDDDAGVFVRDRVPAAIEDKLLPYADVVTPNRFELAHLSGLEVSDLGSARLAAERLLERGPRLVVATGLDSPDRPDMAAMLAFSHEQHWLVRTPRLARTFNGTGDAFSALFLGHYLLAPDLKTALERSASAIFSLVEMTAERGEEELSLVAAQDMLAAKTARFRAVQI
ncbi:MAG: pyridoxal kinase PdxY [Pseudomonadota bacterium]